MIWGYPYFRKPPFGRLSYAEAKSFIFTTSSFVTEHWKFRSKTRRSIYLQTYLKRKCTLKEKNTWSSTKLEDRTSYTAMYALYIYILYTYIYIIYTYIYIIHIYIYIRVCIYIYIHQESTISTRTRTGIRRTTAPAQWRSEMDCNGPCACAPGIGQWYRSKKDG